MKLVEIAELVKVNLISQLAQKDPSVLNLSKANVYVDYPIFRNCRSGWIVIYDTGFETKLGAGYDIPEILTVAQAEAIVELVKEG